MNTKTLYNLMTDTWRYIMGDNFHFGYFRTSGMNLSEATNALIDELTKMGTITEDSKILDVGCGIGTPAFYLYEKFHCKITGITNSERGLELAQKTNEKKDTGKMVQFRLADALNSGFPDGSFDVVWVMESSHLIMDKKNFFTECYRMLKSNGMILLCDVVSKIKMNLVIKILLKYKYKHIWESWELGTLDKTFGNSKTETLKYYVKQLQMTGFSKVIARDISKETFPTLKYWRNNITHKKDKILQNLTKEKMEEFQLACEILEVAFKFNILSYGMIGAIKL